MTVSFVENKSNSVWERIGKLVCSNNGKEVGGYLPDSTLLCWLQTKPVYIRKYGKFI